MNSTPSALRVAQQTPARVVGKDAPRRTKLWIMPAGRRIAGKGS